jgi:hypothetical protein
MFVKPLMSTIEGTNGGLIPSVYAVLKAEIITVQTIHILDIMGNIKRHLLAPHAANQAAMNSYFGGASVFLGEKYTVRSTSSVIPSLGTLCHSITLGRFTHDRG